MTRKIINWKWSDKKLDIFVESDFIDVIKKKSNAELLYARHKLRAGKCYFRSARKRAMNEQLNDGN